MHKSISAALICVCVLIGARDASAQFAQPWTDRGYFNFNGGFESASGQLNDATTRPIYGETASLQVAQPVDSGGFFDFSAGARVWRNVSVGIGFHQGTSDSSATVSGAVPSPIFFNSNRALALTVDELDTTERAIHLQFGYMLPINDRVDVHVMLGPSFFKVRQDVVEDVTITESADFNSVSGSATIAERTDSPVGFNIGVDFSYIAYTTDQVQIGGGLFLRYSGATASIRVLENTFDSDLGGLQIGFGVRTRF